MPPHPVGPEAIEVDLDDVEIDQGALLPRVQEILTRIGTAQERQRFETFFGTAAGAIESLGELDVTGTEDVTQTGTETDRAVWENLAPLVDATLARVRAFLDAVRQQFPIADLEEDQALELALGEDFSFDSETDTDTDETADDGDGERGPVEEIAAPLHTFCSNMEHELKQLEQRLKSPAIMGDRWNLLELLGEFRGRARSGIGEMVFMAARLFAVVRKEDVVPFYEEDVSSSLELRRSIARLRNRIALHRTQLNLNGEPQSVRHSLDRFGDELRGFTTDAVFTRMRAIDKRAFADVGDELATLAERETVSPRALETCIEGLEKFLDSLSLMNRRELLVIHDKELCDDALLHLSTVIRTLEKGDVAAARISLRRSVLGTARLYGKDPVYDGVLTLFEHVELDQLDADEILALANLVRSRLA